MRTNSLFRSRLLIAFILFFASVADLVVLITIGRGFLSIINVFLFWGALFVLQETFKWFRFAMVGVIGAYGAYLFLVMLISVNASNIINFFQRTFVAATAPLYVALIVIGFFTFRFLRDNRV